MNENTGMKENKDKKEAVDSRQPEQADGVEQRHEDLDLKEKAAEVTGGRVKFIR